MKDAPASQSNSKIKYTIPDFDSFANILHDRMHVILKHYENASKYFMLITNLLDRDEERIIEKKLQEEQAPETLRYCGTDSQRRILEKKIPPYNNKIKTLYQLKDKRSKWRKSRNQNWNFLNNRILAFDQEGVETFDYFNEFRKNNLEVSDIEIGSLKKYFSGPQNSLKKNEKPIISDYFDIDQDAYIGIPLLGAGLFQGIVWVIYQSKDRVIFEDGHGGINKIGIKRIIKYFQVEYDNLLLDWDTVGENSRRRSVLDPKFSSRKDSNPIFDIGIKEYYNISEKYHKDRIQQSDEVFNRINRQYIKTAIISILLDSYAHNISAHSLTTLSWWFRERSEYLEDEDAKKLMEDFGRDTNPLILYSKAFKGRTLSRELYPLFKFLLEKGAFWSGVTRETNRSGKSSNLYNVLWHDFVNNPLYLGTIANTEDVKRLNIYITIYNKESNETDSFLSIKQIATARDDCRLDGGWVAIDLQNFKNQQVKNVSRDKDDSPFVKQLELFDVLSNQLKRYRVFFPGGVVGKHAFFTLLENEIRNVKHYSGDALIDIQQNGLTLNISIHERPAFPNQDDSLNQLYKIGVWLGHPQQIGSRLLVNRLENLGGDIITQDTYQPKLGGSYQDKICAAMLMTNTFEGVQDVASKLGETYYPWIKAAYAPVSEKNILTEFELSYRKYKKLGIDRENIRWDEVSQRKASEELLKIFKKYEGRGYLKKYFHLWQGADVISIENNLNLEKENPARFQFTCITLQSPISIDQLKAQGLIRVLQAADCPQNTADAYRAWLPIWLKGQSTNGELETLVIDFEEGDDNVGRITYKGGDVRFESKRQVTKLDKDQDLYDEYLAIANKTAIAIAHGGQTSTDTSKINYRTHGRLMTKFCAGKPKFGKVEDMPKKMSFELMESILTRICIFDRRLYNRLYTGDDPLKPAEGTTDEVQQNRLQLYRERLFLDFRTEIPEHWKTVQEQGFLDQHFLLLHLSFIEGMRDKKGNPYSEVRIQDFINEQILQGKPVEEVPPNFILIITTGRGRMAWWDIIKNDPKYARFVAFRPIESIIAAVENALQISDDFDLKYNLTKLLFGS